MCVRMFVLTAVVLAVIMGGRTSTASAHHLSAKQQYYHANGIVKWIGAHARFTQYNPKPEKKRHWQRAVVYWISVRDRAWAELHPRPTVDVSAWQATVNCENGGRWYDSPGYFLYGLQFDPGTWATAAAHTGHYGTSSEDQVINAIWTAKHATVDPWPNCPDPYFG